MKKITTSLPIFILITMPLWFIIVIFFGYPNETVSIAIGIICLLGGLKTVASFFKDSVNKCTQDNI